MLLQCIRPSKREHDRTRTPHRRPGSPQFIQPEQAPRPSPTTIQKAQSRIQTPQRPARYNPHRHQSKSLVNPAEIALANSLSCQAHAVSLSDTPHVLWPIAALPRSRLPLSWLENTFGSRSNASPGGLFAADIPALEADLCGCVEPTVLVVMLAADSCLYVIERVKKGIYSLSRLVRGLLENDVHAALKGWEAHRELRMDVEADEQSGIPVDSVNWWQAARIEEPASDFGLGEDFAGLQVTVAFGPSEENDAGENSFVDVLEHRGHSLASMPKGLDPHGTVSLDRQGGVGEAMDVEVVEREMKQTPDELLGGMRDQYLQALYVSKVGITWSLSGALAHDNSRHLLPTLPKAH